MALLAFSITRPILGRSIPSSCFAVSLFVSCIVGRSIASMMRSSARESMPPAFRSDREVSRMPLPTNWASRRSLSCRRSARRRALRRQESDRRLAQFVGKGIRDTSLSDLKAGGILSRAELRIIEAMLRPTIQLTNKLTAKQLEGILRPRIGRVMEKARSAILQLQDSAPYDIVSRKRLTSQQPQAQRPTGYAPGGGSCCNANVRSPWRH